MWKLRNYSTLDSNAKLKILNTRQVTSICAYSTSVLQALVRVLGPALPWDHFASTLPQKTFVLTYFYLCVCLCLLPADPVCLRGQEAVIWGKPMSLFFQEPPSFVPGKLGFHEMKSQSGSHFFQQHQHLVVNSVPLVFLSNPKEDLCILLKWDYAPLGRFHVLSILEHWSFVG